MKEIKKKTNDLNQREVFKNKGLSFFEGSEKKLEIVVKSKNLRNLSESFWKKMIHLSKSSALSHIKNKFCDAYLLSESSLFIWKDRFTMITCGKTTLIESALFFLKNIKKKDLQLVIYERKNEFFPLHQFSDFYQDIKKLKTQISGKAFMLGENAGHHLLLFHTENNYSPPQEDTTFEILMYDFKKKIKDLFNSSQWNKKKIQIFTHLDQFFPGFKKDEHLFNPPGYSLNAIKGRKYYTIHITKENLRNIYISFETNVCFTDNKKILLFLKKFLTHFQPTSFDFILLKPFETKTSIQKELKSSKEKWENLNLEFKEYEKISPSYHFIERSYRIYFSHFFQKSKPLTKAKPIEL